MCEVRSTSTVREVRYFVPTLHCRVRSTKYFVRSQSSMGPPRVLSARAAVTPQCSTSLHQHSAFTTTRTTREHRHTYSCSSRPLAAG